MRRTCALLAALVLAGPARLAQQPAPQPAPSQPPLTFKVEVNYVELDASVVDGQGNPISTLTRDDFQVLEDSRPQTLTVFSPVVLPVERADPPLFRAAAVEPDVRTNRREFDGRLFVIVLDDLHTSVTRTGRLRAAASEFVQRHMGANDMAAVVNTSGFTSGAQEFTGSRVLLTRAVNRFAGQRIALSEQSSDHERASRARRFLDTIRNVTDYLVGVRGRRKAVVIFSEGLDYDVTNFVDNRYGGDILDQMRNAIGAAGRANVSFYTIDPRGLSGLEDALGAGASVEDPVATQRAASNALRLSQDSLITLAEQTGGVAAVNRNDYRETFERIVRDNSTYYVLGYYSDNPRRDGRFRNVEVKVRRPGLTVRARKGYIAPRASPAVIKGLDRADASPELREALSSPVPVGGLGITAGAVPFRAVGNRGSVLLVAELDGSRFRFTDKGGTPWTELEMVAVPIDSRGNAREGVRDTVTITPRAQTRDVIVSRGVRLTRRLELAPGRYQVRLSAREAGSGAVGSVLLDLEVPDFAKGPLVMSGLAIGSQLANGVPTVRPDEELKGVLAVAPTVIRDFGRDDQLMVFAEIYDHVPSPHRVEITTTATADSGTVVFSNTDQRESRELGSKGDGFGHVRTIPLKEFSPGRYVLRVQAQTLASDRAIVSRDVEFTVR